MNTISLPPDPGELQVSKTPCVPVDSIPSGARGAELFSPKGAELLDLPPLVIQSRVKDMTGKVVGRLKVLFPVRHKDNRVHWVCKCDCGNYTLVWGNTLRQAKSQSCGCLRRQRASEANLKDIAGLRFGKLTAVVLLPHVDGKNKRYWDCLCDCGEHCSVSVSNLSCGLVKSCGCLKVKHKPVVGDVYGRLTIQQVIPAKECKRKAREVICVCTCGKTIQTPFNWLTGGNTKSCGCLARETSLLKIMKVNRSDRMHGPNHHNWNPALPPEERANRRTPRTGRLRRAIYMRDGYRCTCCNAPKRKRHELTAHHMEPWTTNAELRYDPDNLITLCTRCHKAYHKQFPAKIANTENFIAWFRQQKEKHNGTDNFLIPMAGADRKQTDGGAA